MGLTMVSLAMALDSVSSPAHSGAGAERSPLTMPGPAQPQPEALGTPHSPH